MERAKALLDQAAKFRKLAATLHDPAMKEQATDLATRCEQLAQAIEDRAKQLD